MEPRPRCTNCEYNEGCLDVPCKEGVEVVYACVLGVLVRVCVSGVVVGWGVALYEVWGAATENHFLGVLFYGVLERVEVEVLWEEEEGSSE
jgi:hypothetical protein